MNSHPLRLLDRLTRTGLPLVAALLFMGATEAPLPQPLLLYEFDEGGSEANAKSTGSNPAPAHLQPPKDESGSLWSKDGEGVTGKPGDYALDLRRATGMGAKGVGGVALVENAPLDNLKSFTVAGWYKTASPADGARLVDYAGVNAGFIIGLGHGNLGLQVNDKGWNSDNLHYDLAGIWIFFAVTYDSTATSNYVTFYQGTASDPLTSQKRNGVSAGEVQPNPKGTLAIGNWASGNRVLQGLIDKIVVYGSTTDGSGALTPDQVQALFASTSAH